MKRLFVALLTVASVATVATGATTLAPVAGAFPGTTAWRDGSFVVDTPNLVRRSDIVLGRPNPTPAESMPLGNGALGAAVWSANGFTAQLNRGDTFPDRKSLGHLVIPGLSRMTGAADFSARVDLYDGMLRESGGGMSLTAFVRADAQQLVVDVTGADPNSTQTAAVKLWAGRSPQARASGSVAALAETFVDNNGAGNSGRTFGSLAGLSAGGRNVAGSTPDGLTAQVSFQPNADGSFRVVVAAPTWTGGDAIATTSAVLNGATTRPASEVRGAHLQFWHDFWASAGLIKVTSADGAGDYVENLRTIFLYLSAAQSRGTLPGSQAGVADLFTFSQDHRDWFPSGYWFWNLRMQVAANLSAGLPGLNDPVFRLYQSNVNAIASWTATHYPNHQGLCVPETMRFNGNGTYNGGTSNGSCDSTITPSFNAQNVTTGAEIGLWIWQHYLATDDRAFLSTNYPLIRGAAQFLLSHATTGSDGKLHTRSNAHETQWDVTDPTTDIAAMQAFFPVAVRAAQTLGVDGDLVNQLNAAIPKIQSLPRTDTATQSRLLGPDSDAGGANMIGLSTQPTAQRRNSENIGLEAVFPYNLIGDSGPMTALGRRTYTSRSYVNGNDWSFDALHAARLGLASDMRTALLAAIRTYQVYPSGLASFTGQRANEPYIEHAGVAAATLADGLVQAYDGLLRIAPSWPGDWTGEGTVAIAHNTKVHVQIAGGTPRTVAIVSGAAQQLAVRNPWPGQNVTVVDGQTRATVVGATTSATFTIPAQAGRSYLVERTSAPTNAQPFEALSGAPAGSARQFDRATIGLARQSGTGTISLRSRANGRFVSAGNGSPLIADQTAIGTGQQFDLIDRGNGEVSLRARVNNNYVTAENAGAAPLIANRTALGPWETFQLVHNPNGTVSFLARANNRYVCAENAGAQPLIANRTAIGTWEQFDLINNSAVGVTAEAAPLSPNVHLFYYPWYGSPAVNGSFRHWPQGGHTPPNDIGANFYPTLGPYDSGDFTGAVARHMAWIRQSGAGVIVYSWWGQGSYEDSLATGVLNAAQQQGIKVAWHLEPYGSRTADSTVSDINYINDRYGNHPAFFRSARHQNRGAFYVFESLRITDWAALDQVTGTSSVLAQTTDTTKIAHFSGMYTYDAIAGATAPGWEQAGEFAAAHGLIWAPSVGPGYVDDRAVPGNTTPTLNRDNGNTYDTEWSNALDPTKGGLPTWVSVTSFNEWHEGSVIEPASGSPPAGFGYLTYNGAYGRTGAAAETAYLDRTSFWATEFELRRGGQPNLALAKPATADSQCAPTEGPAKAVNGSSSGGNSDKWCSLGATKFLRIDLGANTPVGRFVVRHAGAGGEPVRWNTRDFDIQTSLDGTAWTTVATARGNTADVTTHPINRTNARFLRLTIITPTQDTHPAARIYEFEAYTA